MLNMELKKIANYLQDGQYHTAFWLAVQLNISDKTVRSRLTELEEAMQKCIRIERKARMGVRMEVLNPEEYHRQMTEYGEKVIPVSSDERVNYIIKRFCSESGYLKLDDLAEEMYISRNTISADLKKVSQQLSSYSLFLESKPGYGIHLVGNEGNKRKALYRNEMNRPIAEKDRTRREIIGKALRSVVEKYHLHFSEFSFQNVVVHLLISLQRIERGFDITSQITDSMSVEEKYIGIVRELTEEIGEELGVRFTEPENKYIALHFMGKQSLHENESGNLIISEQIISLADQMLLEIYETMKIDLRDNLDLRIRMYEHLMPLDIRIQYGLSMKNPMLEEIKENYSFAFLVAKCATRVINREYHCEISEDEVSYFAILFALALEQEKRETRKNRILFVCNSGNLTAQLVAIKYRREFEKYIDTFEICSLEKLKETDFGNYDVILTTVPVHFSVPLPLINVSLSYTEGLDEVRNVLRKQSAGFFDYYYKKELLFTDLSFENKHQLIHEVCNEISKSVKLPQNFAESVIQRDEFMTTACGYHCALLHPYFMNTDLSFASVTVLKEPVSWFTTLGGEEMKVQVLFLVSLAEGELYEIQEFYEALGEFITNKQKVEEFIQDPKLEKLKELFEMKVEE